MTPVKWVHRCLGKTVLCDQNRQKFLGVHIYLCTQRTMPKQTHVWAHKHKDVYAQTWCWAYAEVCVCPIHAMRGACFTAPAQLGRLPGPCRALHGFGQTGSLSASPGPASSLHRKAHIRFSPRVPWGRKNSIARFWSFNAACYPNACTCLVLMKSHWKEASRDSS